ncbi:MAG: alpha/beta fold hydrolase [Hyphomicrobiaceae bacterium]
MTVSRRDIFFTSRDGLRLHARSFDPSEITDFPVICLPGLTRNSRDFTTLADALAEAGHRVIAVDYRGRGKSEYDSDWRNYSPFMEALDVTDLMARESISQAHFIGTSRGGLICMILASMRPTGLLSVVMNDIGPVIEREGLARIIGYVGRTPHPIDWNDAARLVREINNRDFNGVQESEWLAVAQQWFNDDNGRPIQGYDSRLAKAVTNVDLDRALPELWPQFRAMQRYPLLIIRGENSDILSAKTVEKMCRLHPGAQTMVVPGQGHAPLLRDTASISAVISFLEHQDRSTMVASEASAA